MTCNKKRPPTLLVKFFKDYLESGTPDRSKVQYLACKPAKQTWNCRGHRLRSCQDYFLYSAASKTTAKRWSDPIMPFCRKMTPLRNFGSGPEGAVSKESLRMSKLTCGAGIQTRHTHIANRARVIIATYY
ncbi:hypothetical protein Btru_060219 [Bulinus truncatus]|nr:hypothetical protein Btru_060219 [Bulinus truncatus]